MKVLIIGGVAGGASAAARLRRLDEKAQIIMFERGNYISFANCGLPYYIGGEITQKSSLTLQTPESFNKRFNVDVRVNSEVVKINRDKKTVTVKSGEKTYDETYDKLILSMGAEPVRPPIPGLDSKKVFTLRNIPDTFKIDEFIENNKVKTAVVVGAGYIGIEMAENLNAKGISVTVVEMTDQVIAPLDYDMACDVHNHLLAKGVDLKLKNALKSVEEIDGSLLVTLSEEKIVADMMVLAIGVKPESGIAKDAKLTVNPKGAIVVDSSMKTSDNDIYAVGDAIEVINFVTKEKSHIPLAGPANKQGRIAADNICNISSSYKETQGSAILKVFDLTVATTGINEKTAKKLGLNYEKSFTYSGSHAGYYPGATNMSIKLIFDKDNGKILGAQLIGFDGVDKRCDVFASAIRAGMTVYDLTELELCYAPPYSSAKDPVNMAGYVAENILTGKVKVFHWSDYPELALRKDVVLVDVRTELEYQNGHIENTVNIPVDSLRERLGEFEKGKVYYINCQSGLRSYIACRILTGNGFDCYNLSGGYRLYNSIHKKTEVAKMKNPEIKAEESVTQKILELDACGLQCPGPIVKLASALSEANVGEIIRISTTDPAFASDIDGYCRRTGNTFLGSESNKGVTVASIKKGESDICNLSKGNNKNIIVFSGDLDKAIASFIIANAAASMGRKVSMFFTFWGLNILRKREKAHVKKNLIEKMFGSMMPRGSKKLTLSKMNMGGMGAKMIRGVMKKKNVSSLEELIEMAQKNGVELIACSMSMDVMGIKKEELIDGVTMAGATAMLANAEESDMSLFI